MRERASRERASRECASRERSRGPRTLAAPSLRRAVGSGRVSGSDYTGPTVVRRPGVTDLNTDPSGCSDVLNAKLTL